MHSPLDIVRKFTDERAKPTVSMLSKSLYIYQQRCLCKLWGQTVSTKTKNGLLELLYHGAMD